MLTDPEPLLPTRGYRVLCHDATLIDFGAEGMWPRAQLEWTITSLVIGLLRQRGSQANDVRRHHVCGACHWDAVRRQYGDAGADQVPAASP